MLSLDDGGRQVRLYDNDQLSGLDDVRNEYQKLAINALKNGQIEIPAVLSELRGRSSSLMGGGGAERFNLEAPVGKVILSNRPTLRWEALDGAESYTVTIVDPRDNSADALKSPPLKQTTWQVDRALRRGRVYTWQVTATKNSAQIIAPPREAPEAKFKVLEQNEAEEIAQATTNHPDRHLILGLLYARAGLLDDATRELRALAAANPQAEEVKKLVAKLSSERRRGEQRRR